MAGRYISRNHAPGTDDAAVADRNAAADDDISAEPAVIADDYRLCVLKVVHTAVGPEANVALCGEHGVHGRQQAAIRPEKNIVADRHRAAVEHCEVKIRIAVFAEAGEYAVVKIHRTLQKQPRLRIWRKLANISPRSSVSSSSVLLYLRLSLCALSRSSANSASDGS